jgi:hypothetical protein
MIKNGTTKITGIYLNGEEIVKVYRGGSSL